MRGEESLIGVTRQIFMLTTVEYLKITKQDIEEMYPYERLMYFDMVEEYNEQLKKQQKEQKDQLA